MYSQHKVAAVTALRNVKFAPRLSGDCVEEDHTVCAGAQKLHFKPQTAACVRVRASLVMWHDAMLQ